MSNVEDDPEEELLVRPLSPVARRWAKRDAWTIRASEQQLLRGQRILGELISNRIMLENRLS